MNVLDCPAVRHHFCLLQNQFHGARRFVRRILILTQRLAHQNTQSGTHAFTHLPVHGGGLPQFQCHFDGQLSQRIIAQFTHCTFIFSQRIIEGDFTGVSPNASSRAIASWNAFAIWISSSITCAVSMARLLYLSSTAFRRSEYFFCCTTLLPERA